jgi:hypothetical protein
MKVKERQITKGKLAGALRKKSFLKCEIQFKMEMKRKSSFMTSTKTPQQQPTLLFGGSNES